ncbi:MAG TPA: M48 family metalloprotease [Thermoanaerobaculia bacterium]|nr:M48 family metalloprotease [Thermoanaerobaculia bacterium]
MNLRFRAVIAILLMIGFYAFALGIAAIFIGIAWVDIAKGHGVHFRLVAWCGVVAFLILKSLIPRRDRFEAPGPQLFESTQPELFGVIRDVANATKQAMPDELYVIPDVNAWVAHRGGSMGVGTRRVMGIGLPLLQAVTRSQFRAIIAHEFGHYHGGDTALPPWVYRTREAIGRTIDSLAEHANLIHKPFLWYGKFYMRVTQAISRAQEIAADRLAATVAGARNLAEALAATHRSARAFGAYWRNEVTPVLSGGYKPPIASGFREFLETEEIAKALREDVDREMKEGEADVYDSHPPLRERVCVLRAMPPGKTTPDEPLAITLLRDVDEIERGMLAAIDPVLAPTLKDLPWQDAVTKVFAPNWRERIAEEEKVLRDIVWPDLGTLAAAMPVFAGKLLLVGVPVNERTQVATALVGCALATRLFDAGWACDTAPGRPIVFANGEQRIDPFEVMPRLMRGELSADAWREQCRVAGLV